MRNISKNIIVFIGLIALSYALIACSQQPAKKEIAKKVVVVKPKVLAPKETSYCPKVTQLVKVKLEWYGPGGWGSHNPSFSNRIVTFEGAQWQGIRNGKVICIYKGNHDDFPITLQTNRFIQQPSEGSWNESNMKGNGAVIVNCVTDNPARCPFSKSAIIDNPYAAPPPEDDKPIPKE